MKQYKESRLEVRLTNEDKEKIREYAKYKQLTMSEAIRQLCYIAFGQEEENQK